MEQRVKIFYSSTLSGIEFSINTWLVQNPECKIIMMNNGTTHNDCYYVIVTYQCIVPSTNEP